MSVIFVLILDIYEEKKKNDGGHEDESRVRGLLRE
jgi:hypothetical protein